MGKKNYLKELGNAFYDIGNNVIFLRLLEKITKLIKEFSEEEQLSTQLVIKLCAIALIESQ